MTKEEETDQPAGRDHDDGTRSEAEMKGRMKDYARESRFTFRNAAEYQLKRELKEEAMEKCYEQLKNFAVCSEAKGLMVIISCRPLFQKVNECLGKHNGEEAWQAYKEKNKDELERRANLRPAASS
jgi:Cytochrome c oxidase biogenesis protein Cmc1 like